MIIAEPHSVARDFGAAATSYDQAARLQRHMGRALLELGEEIPVCGIARLLDLGCGTGQFASALAEHYPGSQILGIDLSPAMVAHGRSRHKAMNWLVADAAQLPLAAASVDGLFSNLMVQWCADPRPVLEECLRVLRPGGVLMCSTLVQGTLRELDAAWQSADPGTSHINRFETAAALTEKVAEVCPAASVQFETIALRYPSPLALLHELKALGAQFKGRDRRRTATAPGRVRAMSAYYPRTPQGDALASYEAAYIIYRKPPAHT